MDEKKVIKGLEYCSDRSIRCKNACPYYNRDYCEVELAEDALLLIKSQQALLIAKQEQIDLLMGGIKG